MFAHCRKVSEVLDNLLRPSDDEAEASEEGSDAESSGGECEQVDADFDDSFLYFPDVLCDEEATQGLDEEKHKVILKTKCGSHRMTLYFRSSQTVKSLANELDWLTDLGDAYTLIGQNTGDAWTLEQTIASLCVDDFTAYIQLKLKGGGKRAVGGKAKVEKMDKEGKIKELMETVGTSLLRINASNPPNFIKNTVANIVQLKDRLLTQPDLVMDGLRSLAVGDIIKLQTGLSASHSYLRVSATAKALYPTEHLQMEEIGKLCGYTTDAMKGFVELCLLSHYSDDDGVIRWQKMGADLIEIASKNGGTAGGTAGGSAGGAGSDARGLGY
eukprot:Skav236580  [mRNA]  locus=scaffold2180:325059:326042:+ [translate_table: standard]